MKNRRFFKASLLVAVLIDTFYTGMRTWAYLYGGLCLDLGSGKNPGNYPICVLNKGVADERLK